MRFKRPVRGIHIGGCVAGAPWKPDEAAHAHLTGSSPAWAVGYICAETKRDLFNELLHEVAHLAVDAGHDDRWRKQVRRMGGRVPAANRKKPRRKNG